VLPVDSGVEQVCACVCACWSVAQALADTDRRALSAGVELSDLQRQLAEARGERDASQVRSEYSNLCGQSAVPCAGPHVLRT
jgi:hypothetical protein